MNHSISASTVAKQGKKTLFLEVSEERLFFLESRPEEKGRCALIDESNHELTPFPFHIRSRIHEYGGKCFTLCKNHLIFFSDHDLTLYLKKEGDLPQKIYEEKGTSFVDGSLDQTLNNFYSITQYIHEGKEKSSVTKLDLRTRKLKKIHEGEDFYACPRISPCGRFLAFISWNHPNMPWDKTRLWIMDLNNESAKIIWEKEGSTSHLLWMESSTLIFNCDVSGYYNLYSYEDGIVKKITDSSIDYGSAHWIFGTSRFAKIDGQHLCTIGTKEGFDSLYVIDIKKKKEKKIDLDFTSISELVGSEKKVYFIASNREISPTIFSLEKDSFEVGSLNKVQSNLDKFSSSNPCYHYRVKPLMSEDIDLFYYPPTNLKAPPPVIIRIHSGPTAHVVPRLGLDILFFTSRGFGYAEFNYRGSTGYGRAFRESLNGNWGVFDVEDTKHCGQFLVEHHLANPKGLFLKGSSAGGLTCLTTLCQPSPFTAGVCYYGISDLEKMTKQTHRFEAHYLDRLVGPYPEKKELYHKRSPLFMDIKTKPSILFFQGKLDLVTPPEQTLLFYEKLKTKGAEVECMIFEKEGHGFRNGETISFCLEKELAFYKQHLERVK